MIRILKARRDSGFSLVEVTLAIGVVSFALLSLMGAMGTGTTSLRQAIDHTVNAQITQNILGSVRQSDFSLLTNAAPVGWANKVSYFDDRGVAMTNSAGAIYSATTVVQNPATLPGSGAANPNLAMVSVIIVKNADTNFLYRVSAVVANNGQ